MTINKSMNRKTIKHLAMLLMLVSIMVCYLFPNQKLSADRSRNNTNLYKRNNTNLSKNNTNLPKNNTNLPKNSTNLSGNRIEPTINHIDPFIDSIVVTKSRRLMRVYSNGKLFKIYKVSLGKQPVGAKMIQGDKKTPEGIYFIDEKNPNSNFHKSLGISYPNEKDIENAARLGKPVGGNIKIHGLKNEAAFLDKFHHWFDWTAGCIAVTNKEIDELYETVKIGARIEIYP